jgi:hypothetical protein
MTGKTWGRIVIAVVMLVIPSVAGWQAWSYGHAATGSLSAQPDAAIGVWVSDPNWHIAPQLKIDIPHKKWTVDLASPQQALDGSPNLNPGAVALVILWGHAQFSDFVPRTAGVVEHDAGPVPAGEAQLPSDPAGAPLTAQVFQIRAGDFYQNPPIIGGQAVVEIAQGDPPDQLFAANLAGYEIGVPDLGPGVIDATCPPTDHPGLAQTIQRTGGIATEPQWFGQTCPTPPDVVAITLGPNEHLDSSLAQPKDSSAGLIQEWNSLAAPTQAAAHGHLGSFWVNVSDPKVASDAQFNLLVAGALFGIAGGLAATWIVTLAQELWRKTEK